MNEPNTLDMLEIKKLYTQYNIIESGYNCHHCNGFLDLYKIDNSDPSLSGHKVHLSASAHDVHTAWHLIIPTILNHSIDHAKVVEKQNIQRFSDPHNFQCGKMITLYDNGKDVSEWQTIMDEIEMSFIEHTIQQGLLVNGDTPISGSQYASFRYDPDSNGFYQSSTSNLSDLNTPNSPFSQIVITPRSPA